MAPAPNATFETLLALAAPGAAPETTLRQAPATLPSSHARASPRVARAGLAAEGYATKEALGTGSVGTVWLATETALGRDVALKVPHADGGQVAHASLLSEARVLASLEHPAIPPIYSLGGEGGSPFVAMRRVEGISVKVLTEDGEHALWTEWGMGSGDRYVAIVEILARVAEALAHAHERGLVHRDVKPANIVVGSLGQAFLVDWGLAVAVGTVGSTVIAGTPAFMAPEMVLGGVIDERTDVYLLGATLHALLTGKARHEGDSIEEVLRAAVLSQPKRYPADMPALLAELANDATSREPNARPASALEVRDRLRAYRRETMATAFIASAVAPLAALEALVGKDDDGSLVEAERLATVCRFVYRQAAELRTNGAAGAGEDPSGSPRVASAIARLYLARGEAGPARAALSELEGAEREELARAIDALDDDKRRESLRVDHLQRALREHDPRVEARARPWLAAAFAVTVACAIATGRFYVARKFGEASFRQVFWINLGVATAAILIVLAYRRRILSSRPNSVFAALVVTLTSGRLVMRIVDRAHGVELLVPAFGRDMVLGTCLALIGAIATRVKLFWYFACVFALGSLSCTLLPDDTIAIFELTNAVALVGGAAGTWWMSRGAMATHMPSS